MHNAFHRVGPENTAWDGTAAVMHNTSKDDFAIYRWWREDRLLLIDFFDSEGSHVEWEGYYFSQNPLPTMWDESEHRTDEFWADTTLAGVA